MSAVRALRTLPDGTAAESRVSTMGHGWFGLTDADADLGASRPRRLDHGITVLVGDCGQVLAVSKAGAKVTDSDLFYVLREVWLA